MTWIEMMGVWWLAGPVALLAGCGPEHHEPWQGTQRQLLVLGTPEDASDHREPPAVPLLVVRPDVERVPISTDQSTTFRTHAWGLDGDVLLVTDRSFDTWVWSEGLEDPPRLHQPTASAHQARIRMAPDSRYALVSTVSNNDYTQSRGTAYDLASLEPLFSVYHCGESKGGFQWSERGPQAVLLLNTCESLGEIVEYHLDHYTAGTQTRLQDFTPQGVPIMHASGVGGLLLLEFEDRWQLFDLTNDRVILDRPIDRVVVDVDWSLDGRSLLLTEDTSLTRYDASGQARWSADLGFSPGGVTVSPAGDHVSVRSGHGVGQVYLSLVDMGDGSMKRDTLSSTHVSWSPTGRTLAVRRHEIDGGTLALGDPDSFQLTTLPRQCALADGRSRKPLWSPDGERFLCEDACDGADAEDAHQLVLFDVTGTERAALPCDRYGTPHWSPDADAFAVSVTDPGPAPSEDQHRVLVFDLEGNGLDLGPGHLGTDPWRPGPLR